MENTHLKAGGVFVTFLAGTFCLLKKQPFKHRGRLCHIPGRGLFFAEKSPYSTPTQDPLLNTPTQDIRGRSFKQNGVSGPQEVLEKLRGGVARRCDRASCREGHGDLIRSKIVVFAHL